MRRALPVVVVMLGLVGAGLVVSDHLPKLHEAVTEIEYPLRHEDIIRKQAQEKGVDPALIAAVIYAESRFVEGRTSSAGALGLMQITPDTAADIARRSGGTRFTIADLASPDLNIAYGTYHLRYLLDRYGGETLPAVAAYNAGPGHVDRWIAESAANGRELDLDAIKFPETRAYTEKVLRAQREYEKRYGPELGLSPLQSNDGP
jgi:soluble lytic murein transglycosylase